MKLFERRGRVVTDQSLAYSFTRRAIVLSGLQASVAALLGGRMAWLSISQRDKYDRLA
jgi:penicillin-binding protein 2